MRSFSAKCALRRNPTDCANNQTEWLTEYENDGKNDHLKQWHLNKYELD